MNDLAEPVSDSEPRDNETHEGPADGPPPVAWLQRRAERIDGNEGTAASWERLRPHDEKALEALWAEDGSSMPLFGGRWEAHLTVGTHGPRGAADATSPTPLALPRTESAAEADSSAADEEREAEAARAISVGCLRARYYAESERALVRSIWCYRSWPNGVWRPFARQDDAALDAMWRSMVRGQATSECGYVTEDGLYDIRIKRQPADGELLVVMRAVGEPSWNPLKRLSWYARRGWAGDKLPPLSAAEVIGALLLCSRASAVVPPDCEGWAAPCAAPFSLPAPARSLRSAAVGGVRRAARGGAGARGARHGGGGVVVRRPRAPPAGALLHRTLLTRAALAHLARLAQVDRVHPRRLRGDALARGRPRCGGGGRRREPQGGREREVRLRYDLSFCGPK